MGQVKHSGHLTNYSNLAPINNLYFVCGSGFDGVYKNAIQFFRDRGTEVFTYEKITDLEHVLKNKELDKCNHNCVVLDDWTKDDLKNPLLVKLYSHGWQEKPENRQVVERTKTK